MINRLVVKGVNDGKIILLFGEMYIDFRKFGIDFLFCKLIIFLIIVIYLSFLV